MKCWQKDEVIERQRQSFGKLGATGPMCIGLEALASLGWVASFYDLNDPELQIFDTKSILSYKTQNTNTEFNVSLFHQRHLPAEWQNTKYKYKYNYKYKYK